MSNRLVYPDFTNSLVNIPHTILAHFGVPNQRPALQLVSDGMEGCSKVVLFVADGLGYNLLNKASSKGLFRNSLQQSGLSQKLTTVFPSTTPPALTTLNSGLTPKEHGLLEWNLFLQELDMIIETLPYKRADLDSNEELPRKPELLFDGETLYEQLPDSVSSFYFVARPYANSVYTEATSRGAAVQPYDSLADLMEKLRIVLESTEGQAYCYVHWAAIDVAGHTYGTESKEVEAQILSLSDALENELFKKIEAMAAANTAFLLTADHGQVPVKPDETIYLNQYEELVSYLKKSYSGKTILPTGGARDVFLGVEDSEVRKVATLLEESLRPAVSVVNLDQAMLKRLFGEGEEHREFKNRLGNLLLLPEGNNEVWYKYIATKELTERGDHGGLTADEMFIPLLAARMDRLR